MPKPEKIALVEQVAKMASEARSIFLTNFTGLTVEEMNELRRACKEASVEFKVIKNRLAKLSFQKVGYEGILDYLRGPTAFAFAMDDPVAPAKILLDFARRLDKPKVKAFIFEGSIMEGSQAEAIASLPSRGELISQVVWGIGAPLVNLVGVFQGLLQNLVGVLNAIKDKKSQE